MSEVFAATIDSAVKQRPASCQGLERKGGARGRSGPRTENFRAWQKPLPRWKAMTTAAARNSHRGVSIEGKQAGAGRDERRQHQTCATKNHNQLATSRCKIGRAKQPIPVLSSSGWMGMT